jgi:hypothetical protein
VIAAASRVIKIAYSTAVLPDWSIKNRLATMQLLVFIGT